MKYQLHMNNCDLNLYHIDRLGDEYPIWKIVDDSQIRDVLYQKCMKTVSIYSWKEAVKKFCNTGSS